MDPSGGEEEAMTAWRSVVFSMLFASTCCSIWNIQDSQGQNMEYKIKSRPKYGIDKTVKARILSR